MTRDPADRAERIEALCVAIANGDCGRIRALSYFGALGINATDAEALYETHKPPFAVSENTAREGSPFVSGLPDRLKHE